jgi:hypothetical protein
MWHHADLLLSTAMPTRGPFQWPSGLRRGTAVARLLKLRVRIPQSRRDTDLYLLWLSRVIRQRSLRRADSSSKTVLPSVVCHCVWSRNLRMRRPWPALGCCARKKGTHIMSWLMNTKEISHVSYCTGAEQSRSLERNRKIECFTLQDENTAVRVINYNCTYEE